MGKSARPSRDLPRDPLASASRVSPVITHSALSELVSSIFLSLCHRGETRILRGRKHFMARAMRMLSYLCAMSGEDGSSHFVTATERGRKGRHAPAM